ncbi:MAG: hypothetical protein WEC84_04005 [Candidatus Andersenbacteria bacterium]
MISTVYRVSLLAAVFLLSPAWAFAQVFDVGPGGPGVRCPVIIVPGLAASHNAKLILHDEPGGAWDFTPSVDWFDSLIERLEGEGYTPDHDLFVAFYDWRQGNHASASEYLKPVIDEAVSKTFEDKVCVVAHSMGGLVTRAYIQDEELYENDIAKVVFLGTPNEGAAAAYLPWEGGRLPLSWNFFSRQWIDRIERVLKKERGQKNLERPLSFRSLFPSLKELLPTYQFLNRAGNQLALESHKEENEFLQELNATKSELITKGIEVTTIAGANHDTIDQISIIHDRTVEDLELSRWRDGRPDPNPPQPDSIEGDQTVLMSSVHSVGGNLVTFPNTTHEELPQAAQEQVLIALNITPQIFPFVTRHLASAAIGVDILSPLMPVIHGPNGEVLSSTANTFPNAVFDWDPANPDRPKMLTITDPPPGIYTVTTTGTGSGEYTIITSYADVDDEVVAEYVGVTEEGAVYEYTFTVEDTAFVPPVDHMIQGVETDQLSNTDDDDEREVPSTSPTTGSSNDTDCCPGPDPIPHVEETASVGRVAGMRIQPPACELLPTIRPFFKDVFGRSPTETEYSFWAYRLKRGDKQTKEALIGALQWFKDRGASHDAKLTQTPSITARCSNNSLVSSINQLFRKAFDRNPTAIEHQYWLARIENGEKATAQALLGAMQWQTLHSDSIEKLSGTIQ